MHGQYLIIFNSIITTNHSIMFKQIIFNPIGFIHSPFNDIQDMPIQPSNGKGVKGTIELNKEYVEGLKDIEGFSHITLIYYLHKITEAKLLVKPFMDNELHGIFATRAPVRPNAIGISTVLLLKVENNILHIQDIDILDGTPLLDIKPFFPQFDNRNAERVGWLTNKENIYNVRSDERFE